MRKALKGRRGYGKYRCGNCKWFKEPRSWGRKGEGSCVNLFGVDFNQRPCPALQKGLVGEFTPIDRGSEVAVVADHLVSMAPDDLQVLRALIRDREVAARYEQLSSFRVGDRVQATVADQQHIGEVVAISEHYVTIEVGASRWRMVPSSLKKV